MAAPHVDITGDLMTKVTEDVTSCLWRTLSIAPEPHLPIATAAGAVVMGFISRFLQHMSGESDSQEPDVECIILAGLLCARMSLDPSSGVAQAYRDFEILKQAGVVSAKPL